MSTIVVAIIIIVIALIFEFINGFHDTANAVATSIATKSLEPLQAISVSAIFNLLGAMSGTAVAVTITKGFADPALATHPIIFATLIAAITWNLTTWYFGIPSSSSHALIGSLVGAIIFDNGWKAVSYSNIVTKVLIPMIVSPVLGFVCAFLIVLLIFALLKNNSIPRQTNNFIRELQVLSTAFLSFSHGTNDAQKSMAIITLTLFNCNLISKCEVPTWVIMLCAICMALGTISGGIKIIRTLSTRVAKLMPSSGLAAELSSAILLFVGSRFGMPLSTTHAVSGSIMGAGSTGRLGVNWAIVKNIIIAWVLTFPTCALLAGLYLQIEQLFIR